VKRAGSLGIAISLLLAASARAQERTQRKVREERAADRTRSSLSGTDNAASPNAVADAERRHDERNDVRLGDLPVAYREDVAKSAAQILPGVAVTGSGVRLRGGSPATAAIFLDGFRLYRLRAPRTIVDRSDVLTAGYGVSFADLTGGAVFLRTDSRPGVRARIEVFRESQDGPQHPEQIEYTNNYVESMHRQRDVLSGGAAAPLLHDRLLVTLAVDHSRDAGDGLRDREGILPTPPGPKATSTTLALGLSGRVNPRHHIDGLAMVTWSGADDGDGLGVMPEAQPSRESAGFMGGLRWIGRLTPTLTGQLQASTEFHKSTLEPRFCRDHLDACDSAWPIANYFPRYILTQNGLERGRDWVSTSELGGSLEVQLGGAGATTHRLSVSSRLQFEKSSAETAIPGNRIDIFNGTGVPVSQITAIDADGSMYADSLFTGARINTRRTLTAVEDQISVAQRLWLRPGLGLVTSTIQGAGDLVLVADAALVGSLSAGWDVDGDGRLWLRASANHRVDPTSDGAAGRLPNVPLRRTCLWNPVMQSYEGNCTRSGGPATQTVGLPCGATGVTEDGSPCRRPPSMPGTWEYTAGVRQRLGATTWVDLDGVYRRTRGLVMVDETNRIWNGSTATSGYRNGRTEIVRDLSGSEDLFRRYVGATLSVGGHLGDLRGLAAYTYSHQDVGRALLHEGASGTAFIERADPDERRHALRLVASYTVLDTVGVGVVYTRESGRQRTSGYVPANDPIYTSYEGQRGVNPGADLNDPGDNRVDREPSIQRLNLQVRLRLGQWLPFGADVYADVLNALDAKDTPVDFGGHWTRLGVEARY
jgi:hypothetical protein